MQTLIIGCSDRRVKGSRGMAGEYMGVDESIPITIPGGPKDLVFPSHPRDRESLLEKISLVGDNLRLIIAKAHNECLACARCDDPAFYEDLLEKASEVLIRRFPGVKVAPIFVDFDGIYLVENSVLVGVC
ncbi:MAG TPA: hypothetical protein VMA75_01775 [Candidatus Paceibacterota bacterium]|nr:hypothetical protein [Candidatus Paceibacterota bacterium]